MAADRRALVRPFFVALLLAVAIPRGLVAQDAAADAEKPFVKTEAMIGMRDGVKLHTLIYVPKAKSAALPFILLRTPYGVDKRGPESLQSYLKDLADEGYIFVFQDIRGQFR